MPTIEIDSEVYGAIEAEARGCYLTLNAVLRRLLRLRPEPASEKRPRKRRIARTGPELVEFLRSAPPGATDLVVERDLSARRAADLG